MLDPILASRGPEFPPDPPATMPVAERRRVIERTYDEVMSRLGSFAVAEDVEIRDRTVHTPTGAVPVRCFIPTGDHDVPLPVYLYFYGGGWWRRIFDTAPVIHDLARTASQAQVVVVAVDYPLAPENAYPIALTAVHGVFEWTVGDNELPIDRELVAVGGCSSGGNLAAALSLLLRDRAGSQPRLQILEVPALDLSVSVGSNGESDPAAAAGDLIHESVQFYLAGGHRADEPLVSPLRAPDLSGLPPTHILWAELDPLGPQAKAYTRRLMEAGVDVVSVMFQGQVHDTPELSIISPSARAWRSMVCSALKTLHEEPDRRRQVH